MSEKNTEHQLKEFEAYAEMRTAADRVRYDLDNLARAAKAKKHASKKIKKDYGMEYYLDYLEGEVGKAVTDFRIKRGIYLVLAGSESKEDSK